MEDLQMLIHLIDAGGTLSVLVVVSVMLYRRLNRQEEEEDALRDEFIDYLRERANGKNSGKAQ